MFSRQVTVNMPFFCFLIFACTLSCVKTLYENHPDVIELHSSTFNSEVISSQSLWIVEFYASWCGHCQALVSEYSKTASALKGVVKVGAINADKYRDLGQQYEIKGFPTIKIFGHNKRKPMDYSAAKTVRGMTDRVLDELKQIVKVRLGGRHHILDKEIPKKEGNTENVIELRDSNFKEIVLNSNDMWLVEFYAPWCGHCQKLKPHWTEAAAELKGKIKLGAIDATVQTITARKYNIQGFPTIKFFPEGSKDGTAEEYDGGRTAQEIINWAMEKYADFTPAPEIKQITQPDTVKDACQNQPVCVISILPHILDCQSKCRNEYIDVLKKVGEMYRKNRWNWIWAEAMAQPKLEETLGIGGFGYPAMAVVNSRKMKYSLLLGPFSYDGILEFIRTVSVGRGTSAPIKEAKFPEILNTEPWDGKDGAQLEGLDFDEYSPSDEGIFKTKQKTEL